MKRTLTLISLAVILASCTKNYEPVMQEVVFYPSCVRSGEMTRATPGGVVSEITPSGLPTLTLTSKTNTARVYEVQAGESVSLPLDAYTITGIYIPTVATHTTAARGRVYTEPSYAINAEVTITEGQTAYSVPVRYTCFAIVVDFSETEGAYLYDATMNYTEVQDWVRSENYGILFLSATTQWNSSLGCTIIVRPTDKAEHENKSYKMVTTGTGGVLVENGKWYCFSPSAVDTENGSISFTFPGWEQGTV